MHAQVFYFHQHLYLYCQVYRDTVITQPVTDKRELRETETYTNHWDFVLNKFTVWQVLSTRFKIRYCGGIPFRVSYDYR